MVISKITISLVHIVEKKTEGGGLFPERFIRGSGRDWQAWTFGNCRRFLLYLSDFIRQGIVSVPAALLQRDPDWRICSRSLPRWLAHGTERPVFSAMEPAMWDIKTVKSLFRSSFKHSLEANKQYCMRNSGHTLVWKTANPDKQWIVLNIPWMIWLTNQIREQLLYTLVFFQYKSGFLSCSEIFL